MEKKRRRIIRSENSDEDDGCQVINPHEKLMEMISEAHDSTKKEIKTVINSDIVAKTNELKSDIQDSRETERYVAKKHADQASMLRQLNHELKEERSSNAKLASENAKLQYQQGRHDAFQDCVQMMGEIMDEMKSIKKKLKTVDGRMKSIESQLEESQDEH